jgi:hypothetical protein
MTWQDDVSDVHAALMIAGGSTGTSTGDEEVAEAGHAALLRIELRLQQLAVFRLRLAGTAAQMAGTAARLREIAL